MSFTIELFFIFSFQFNGLFALFISCCNRSESKGRFHHILSRVMSVAMDEELMTVSDTLDVLFLPFAFGRVPIGNVPHILELNAGNP